MLSSLLAGTLISQTGSLVQLCTKNILASPSTLGFDGLSVLWILLFHSLMLLMNADQPVIVILLLGIPSFIFIGFIFARLIEKSKNIERLILLGLTFNLAVGALFSLWQFLFLAFNFPFPVELWFGNFKFSNSDTFLVLGFLESLFLFGWFRLRKEFYLFSLGDSLSINLGLQEKKIYLFIFSVVSVTTFVVVALFGAFSFLALIFPIIARKLWFKSMDLSGELLVGSLFNGALLMFIDTACYFGPIQGAELPVGLIATGVGAVSLIFILWKSDNAWEILAKRRK